MRDAFALLTAGVGIFFLGMELVTTGLRESTSRTLRTLIRRSTKNLPTCAGLGVFAGGLMQSTSAVATVLGSMAAAGMITLRQALPIVAFANVGTTLLVFAGALDIRLAVLFAVGVAGIGHSLTNAFRWKAAMSVALGIALLLYGGDLMTAAAVDVEHANWFSVFLLSWSGAPAMAFGLGVLASFLTQSTTAVALMTVAVADAGLLPLGQAVMMMYGANLGSTLMRMLLTRRTSGTLRQVSRYQDLFKLAGTALFVALFYLERATGLPLVQALLRVGGASLPLQLAAVNLMFNGSLALLAASFADPIERLVARTWPPSAVEDLSVPRYATDDSLSDPATAIDLLEKEQMRILKSARDYLALVRPHARGLLKVDPESLHRSFAVLFVELQHFHVALMGRHIDEATSERLGNVHGRQEILQLVEQSLHELAMSAEAMPSGGRLEHLIENFAEALDFLLMFAGDAARTLDRDRAEFVFELSSDRGDMMGSFRTQFLAPDQALGAEDKALLLRLTTLFERLVWMVQRYADLLIKNVAWAEAQGWNGQA